MSKPLGPGLICESVPSQRWGSRLQPVRDRLKDRLKAVLHQFLNVRVPCPVPSQCYGPDIRPAGIAGAGPIQFCRGSFPPIEKGSPSPAGILFSSPAGIFSPADSGGRTLSARHSPGSNARKPKSLFPFSHRSSIQTRSVFYEEERFVRSLWGRALRGSSSEKCRSDRKYSGLSTAVFALMR